MRYEFHNGQLDIMDGKKYENKPLAAFFNDYRISRKNRSLILTNHQLLANGIPLCSEEDIIPSGVLTLLIPEEEPDWVAAAKPCPVVYSDPFIYLAHKEAGIIIHGDENDVTCLNAQAARYQRDNGINAPVRPIHRLDKDTRGLVLFSKIPFFQPWLDFQLAEKKIRRKYLAIVKGSLTPGKKFDCDKPIAKDRHRSGCYRTASVGMSALTHIECLESHDGYSLLSCELETGRTHQIRVHLGDCGLPIVNDPLYGMPSKDFGQMELWANEIVFRNPLTNKKHRILDGEDPDFASFRR